MALQTNMPPPGSPRIRQPVPPGSVSWFFQILKPKFPKRKIPNKRCRAKDPKRKIPSLSSQAKVPKLKIPSDVPKLKFQS